MRTLEVLLGRRWILKDRDRELYYRMRDELGTVKRFITEKLGYQVIVNRYLIKVEKLPAKAESWMGITEFKEPMEYVFFCLVLMFLEEKDAGEQFVLSELTEYVAVQYRQGVVDWTKYSFRRQLIRVLKYCTGCGILNIDDGSEENFAKDSSGEVLYENTGSSRYFMRSFTQDIMGYTCPEDFAGEEWIGVDEDRGIVRRQRVYRRLLMGMGMYREPDTEEDFNYLRNFRNLIGEELSGMLGCDLHVHRGSAYLVLDEDCRMGRCFPEDHTLSDIVLLFNGLFTGKLREGVFTPEASEVVRLPGEVFLGLLEECRERYSKGFNKTYREMTGKEFAEEVCNYMSGLGLIEWEQGDVRVSPAVGKLAGYYPEDFDGTGRTGGEEGKV